jgi:hypothetical protein
MDHFLWVRSHVGAPGLFQRPDVEEPDAAEMLDDGVGLQLSFVEEIRLILADVIRPELVGRAVEVMGILFDGPKISACCAGCVVSTFEFLEHQLLEIGHRDLLVTAPYRDSTHTKEGNPLLTRGTPQASAVRLRSSRHLSGDPQGCSTLGWAFPATDRFRPTQPTQLLKHLCC